MAGAMNEYYNLDDSRAYTGSLRNLTKGDRQLEKWFLAQPTFTLHRPARRKFPTRKYISSSLDHLWQCDLVDMQQFKQQNRGYSYILTAIDVFSRYAWGMPIKSKHSENIVNAFQDIFKMGRKPSQIQTDQGTEFENRIVQSFFKKHGVHHYSVKSQFKASLVERFHRTLRGRMFRYFTKMGTRQWFDVLQKLIDGYNNTPHRGIAKKKPSSLTKENQFDEWKRKAKELRPPTKKPKFEIGDYVRLQKAKKTFDRGYLPNYTMELFRISKVNLKYTPVTYSVIDDAGEEIEGSFYEPELQKVEPVYRIEKIIRSKKVKGKKYMLVKWLGDRYPKPEWIPADSLE
jgi:hypothetical protein